MLEKKCDNFTLEIELQMRKPDDDDFKKKVLNLGLQYGADFELRCSRNGTYSYPIGILQFVKPSQIVGNPLGDAIRNIYIDKIQFAGKVKLKKYLYGEPGENITHAGTWVTGKPICVRKENQSVIHDTPRELIGYDLDAASQTLILSKVPKLEFYDFLVEIQGEYCIIYPLGVGFEISVEQKKNDQGEYLNIYEQKVSELKSVNFEALKLKKILEIDNKIDQNSYKIIS